jgi:hypothetical protein
MEPATGTAASRAREAVAALNPRTYAWFAETMMTRPDEASETGVDDGLEPKELILVRCLLCDDV